MGQRSWEHSGVSGRYALYCYLAAALAPRASRSSRERSGLGSRGRLIRGVNLLSPSRYYSASRAFERILYVFERLASRLALRKLGEPPLGARRWVSQKALRHFLCLHLIFFLLRFSSFLFSHLFHHAPSSLSIMTISQSPSSPLVVVGGATGNQGGSVIAALAESTADYRIRGLTRDASRPGRPAELKKQGVTMVSVELKEVEAIAKAYEGADVVFVSREVFDLIPLFPY